MNGEHSFFKSVPKGLLLVGVEAQHAATIRDRTWSAGKRVFNPSGYQKGISANILSVTSTEGTESPK